MSVKVKKHEDAQISYRLPNIIESMRLIGSLGVNADGSLSKNEIEMMADLIECLEPYIQEIKKGSKVLSWGEALEDISLVSPLAEIGTEILNSLNQSDKRRKQRKKS